MWVENPVMEQENFADKWKIYPKRREAFMAWIQRAKKELIGQSTSGIWN